MGGPGVLAPLEKEVEDLIFTEAEVVDLWPETPDPAEHLRRIALPVPQAERPLPDVRRTNRAADFSFRATTEAPVSTMKPMRWPSIRPSVWK